MAEDNKDPWVFEWDEPNANYRIYSFHSYHLNEKGYYAPMMIVG